MCNGAHPLRLTCFSATQSKKHGTWRLQTNPACFRRCQPCGRTLNDHHRKTNPNNDLSWHVLVTVPPRYSTTFPCLHWTLADDGQPTHTLSGAARKRPASKVASDGTDDKQTRARRRGNDGKPIVDGGGEDQ